MMCSGTEYSHEKFFYTGDVSNFWFAFLLWLFLLGLTFLGSQSRRVSASNKIWTKLAIVIYWWSNGARTR